MTRLLEAMEIPYFVLPRDEDAALDIVDQAVAAAERASAPVAILVEADTFAPPTTGPTPAPPATSLPSREEALIAFANAVGDEAVVVCTTGMLGRELFEHRQEKPPPALRDFLSVGGMGHASSIAQGIAAADSTSEVWAFDGDGALLMHQGSLAVFGKLATPNFFHVVFNNGFHYSVCWQPTAISIVDFPDLAMASGYRGSARIVDLDKLPEAVAAARVSGGPFLIEVQVRPGNRAGIGRPTRTPKQSKDAFMAALRAGA
jgi:phosphonopyruvate decarboxylase